MNVASWLPLIPAVIVAALVLVLPGLAIVAAATRLRPVTVAVAPAVSIAVLGVSGVLWALIGVRWSLAAVIVTTLVVAAVAYAIRRGLGADRVSDGAMSRSAWLWAAAGLVTGGAVLAVQVVRGIGWADAISQSPDVVFHLNAIEHVLRSGDGSIFGLGDFTGNAYYPLGWHQAGALVTQLAGVSIPHAAHALNIAIAAVVWPAGCVALASVVFRHRVWAPAVAGLLSAGFGAFPFRLLEHGVIYPNLLSFALVPSVLALVVHLCNGWLRDDDAGADDGQLAGTTDRTSAAGRTWVLAILLLTAVVGTALAQPNGVLGTMALALPVVVWAFVSRTVVHAKAGRTAAAVRLGAITVAYLVVNAVIWQVVRPPYGDWWPTNLTVREAVRITVLGAPAIGTWAWVVAILIVVGLVAVVLTPRRLWVAGPFVVASVLYVTAAALPVVWLRDFLTGGFFRDPPRLAALVPVGAVLVCTAGAMLVVDVLKLLARRVGVGSSRRVTAVGGAALALLLAYGVGPANAGVTHTLQIVRMFHAPLGRLLTPEEREVLEALADHTEPDAVIAGDPTTGAALAFALAERTVTEPHIFSTPTEDQIFLAGSLRDIDDDPRVCAAVKRAGVGYVLDFGSLPVVPNLARLDYSGFHDLEPGQHLELVLSRGKDAELYRITGC